MRQLHSVIVIVFIGIIISLPSCLGDDDESDGRSSLDDDTDGLIDDSDDDSADDDTASPDDDLNDDADDDSDDDDDLAKLCPPNFHYFPGGSFVVHRAGNRWGQSNLFTYDVFLEPFCLADFEASLPGATDVDPGDLEYGAQIPPAQVLPNKLPIDPGWYLAAYSCQEQGWRLPAYAETQFVATKGDPDNLWVFGPRWECELSSLSWYETCDGPRSYEDDPVGTTGGPTMQGDYGTGVFDLLGGVAEWTSTPWDVDCYGLDRFSLFGGATWGHHMWTNTQEADLDLPGCWQMSTFGGYTRGEHEHEAFWGDKEAPDPKYFTDDGFRPAADPGPQWLDWEPLTEYQYLESLAPMFYYDPVAGERVYYDIPPSPWK